MHIDIYYKIYEIERKYIKILKGFIFERHTDFFPP